MRGKAQRAPGFGLVAVVVILFDLVVIGCCCGAIGCHCGYGWWVTWFKYEVAGLTIQTKTLLLIKIFIAKYVSEACAGLICVYCEMLIFLVLIFCTHMSYDFSMGAPHLGSVRCDDGKK